MDINIESLSQEMTVYELAVLMMECLGKLEAGIRKDMNHGFRDVNYRIDECNQKINGMSKRVDALDTKTDRIETKLNSVVLNHGARIELAEDDIKDLKKTHKKLGMGFA